MRPPRARLGLGAFLLLLATFVAAPSLPATQRPSGDDSDVGKPGWCIVCQAPATPGALTEIYKGRRITVCNERCLAAWHEHRAELFPLLQARGALFDEEAMDERSLMSGWMWFGVYVLAGLVCGAIAAYVALGKGLAPLPSLVAGLLLNVVALALVAARPRGDVSNLPEGVPDGLRKVPATYTPLPCPKCGHENHPSARACARCGAALAPQLESEAQRAGHGDAA